MLFTCVWETFAHFLMIINTEYQRWCLAFAFESVGYGDWWKYYRVVPPGLRILKSFIQWLVLATFKFISDLPYYLGFLERPFCGTAPTIYKDYVDIVLVFSLGGFLPLNQFLFLLSFLSTDYLGFFPTERAALPYDYLAAAVDQKAIDYFFMLRLVS